MRHWLALVNYQTGRQIFDVDGAPATAIAPVVIAIWESRLDAIKAKNPGQEIGWQELFDVFKSPNGWRTYGMPGRQAVYYGHTDPFVSSTALVDADGRVLRQRALQRRQRQRRQVEHATR